MIVHLRGVFDLPSSNLDFESDFHFFLKLNLKLPQIEEQEQFAVASLIVLARLRFFFCFSFEDIVSINNMIKS